MTTDFWKYLKHIKSFEDKLKYLDDSIKQIEEHEKYYKTSFSHMKEAFLRERVRLANTIGKKK